jgi:CBS-domain-containing membrane protein
MHALDLDHIMHCPVQGVSPQSTVLQAIEIAQQHDVHHLPVMVGNRPIGLVCTCDLEECQLTESVGSIMHRRVVTVQRGASCSEVVRMMNELAIGSVLVMDEGQVAGIVTRRDLDDAGISPAVTKAWRCDCCGGMQHLRKVDGRGTLCTACLDRAQPAAADDDTGVVD